MANKGVCFQGGVWTGVAWSGGAWSRWSAWSGGCLVLEGCEDCPGMATAAGGMHPTGMHSCKKNEFSFLMLN